MNFIKNSLFAFIFLMQTAFSAQFAGDHDSLYLTDDSEYTNIYSEFLCEGPALLSLSPLISNDTGYRTDSSPVFSPYSVSLSFQTSNPFDHFNEEFHSSAMSSTPEHTSLSIDPAVIAAYQLLPAPPAIELTTPAIEYQCKFCAKTFENQNMLGTHWFEKHLTYPKKIEDFLCPEQNCQVSTRTQILIEHVEIKHPELCRSICDICNKGFLILEEPKDHYHYQCKIKGCKHVTYLKGKHHLHEQNHLKHLKRQRNQQLETKQNNDGASKDDLYQCKNCSATFEYASLLGTHWHENHTRLKQRLATEVDYFSCPHPTCTETMRWKKNMIKHIERKHPDICYETCSICKHAFLTKEILHKHSDYRCLINDCIYAAYQESILNKHKKTAHAGRSCFAGGSSSSNSLAIAKETPRGDVNVTASSNAHTLPFFVNTQHPALKAQLIRSNKLCDVTVFRI